MTLCVLRLARVRARPYARVPVSRVCITFHATAYASFCLAQVCKHRPSRARFLSSLSVKDGPIIFNLFVNFSFGVFTFVELVGLSVASRE